MERIGDGMTSGVCFPGLDGYCALCADEGAPGRVLAVYPTTAMALVDINGASSEVAVDLLDGVAVGDTILVHLGFAIARLELTP